MDEFIRGRGSLRVSPLHPHYMWEENPHLAFCSTFLLGDPLHPPYKWEENPHLAFFSTFLLGDPLHPPYEW